MNYREAIAYIEEIPRFTKKNSLDHTRELLARLGNPEKGIKIIHVAGTNGKGSTCAYLNAMLMAGGYSVGLFTSPHLIKHNERYRINGTDVTDEVFLAAFEKVEAVSQEFMAEGEGHPSYFEMLFLMGMVIFSEAGVEYLILETGLGGRKDATNVFAKPLACIITSISRDHTEYLGETIPEIAGEKAGIIKPGVPVIYDGHDPAAAKVIRERAGELGSPAYELTPGMYTQKNNTKEGITFSFHYGSEPETELFIPYIANYQMMNASLAYFTMRKLDQVHRIAPEVLRTGISGIEWPCRMETVMPGVIIDGAHNEDGVAEFVKTASYFSKDYTITILFSAVSDKRYRDMIREVSEGIHPEHVVATSISGSRAVPAALLAEDFRREGCRDVEAVPDVREAFELAYQKKGDGMLFCVGSLYLAGELKDHISRRNS